MSLKSYVPVCMYDFMRSYGIKQIPLFQWTHSNLNWKTHLHSQSVAFLWLCRICVYIFLYSNTRRVNNVTSLLQTEKVLASRKVKGSSKLIFIPHYKHLTPTLRLVDETLLCFYVPMEHFAHNPLELYLAYFKNSFVQPRQKITNNLSRTHVDMWRMMVTVAHVD